MLWRKYKDSSIITTGMQVVVYGKQYKEKDLPHIQELFDVLADEGITA